MTEHKGRWLCSDSWQAEFERVKKSAGKVPGYSEDQATISIWVNWLEQSRDYILQLEAEKYANFNMYSRQRDRADQAEADLVVVRRANSILIKDEARAEKERDEYLKLLLVADRENQQLKARVEKLDRGKEDFVKWLIEMQPYLDQYTSQSLIEQFEEDK